MRLIDADALDKFLEDAEIEARKNRKYIFANAINTIRGNVLFDIPTVDPTQSNTSNTLDALEWIPVAEKLPEEHESIFARLYGTEKWRNAMFKQSSNTVIVTVEYRDGTRQVAPNHTIDGDWNDSIRGMGNVIAWMPLPDPYKEDLNESKSDNTD